MTVPTPPQCRTSPFRTPPPHPLHSPDELVHACTRSISTESRLPDWWWMLFASGYRPVAFCRSSSNMSRMAFVRACLIACVPFSWEWCIAERWSACAHVAHAWVARKAAPCPWHCLSWDLARCRQGCVLLRQLQRPQNHHHHPHGQTPRDVSADYGLVLKQQLSAVGCQQETPVVNHGCQSGLAFGTEYANGLPRSLKKARIALRFSGVNFTFLPSFPTPFPLFLRTRWFSRRQPRGCRRGL